MLHEVARHLSVSVLGMIPEGVMLENQCSLTGFPPSGDNPPKTNWEDIHSKRLVDSASRHVTEGRFEQARLQLEAAQRLCAETKGLAELLAIAEVCLAAVGRSCHCQPRRPKLPDWYHILKVDEKADINLIKKRYRQLALILHPDKSTHVKAEGAFHYISQAYDCLSDKNKRSTFNLERAKLFCRRCSVLTEARDSIPTAADKVSRRSSHDEQMVAGPRESCSGVCSPTKLVWESARLRTFRNKARARAEAAGSELGSRVWRWNKEFEKLNIRRDDTDYERPRFLYPGRRHVNEARASAGYMWRNKRSRADRSIDVSMSGFESDDTGQVDERKMPGNGTFKQTEKPVGVSENLDDVLNSLKSEAGEGHIPDSSTLGYAYPSSATGFCDSGDPRNLPTTADIINFFKELPLTTSRPAPADDPKKLITKGSLKDVYFPSKKGLDSSSVQENQEQCSIKSQHVVPSPHRVYVLPDKELSGLDSNSLLKNLDAALADITLSAGKSDHSMSTVSKSESKCPGIGSSLERSSLSSKFSVRVKPPRKPVSGERTDKVETNDQFSSGENDKRNHSQRAEYCGGHSDTSSCSLDSFAKNPSLLITPLLRKQGRNNMSETGSSVLATQWNGSIDSHVSNIGSLDFISRSPVLNSGTPLFREIACQTKTTEKIGTSQTTISENSESPLRREPSKGLNPLLSCEKLGRWMDGLAGSSHVAHSGSHGYWKPDNLETSSSGREEDNTARITTRTWLESKDQIPSYLTAKAVGTLLPDYGRMWLQADDYSDPPKKAPSVTSSTSKSDFSCNPAISLASATRTPTSDFSCIPEMSLASSTPMATTIFSCNPAGSLASSSRMTSSNLASRPANSLTSSIRTPTDVSCSPGVTLPPSTRLLGSEDPPQLSGLRFLQTGRFETIARSQTTKILDSAASEIYQNSDTVQMPSPTLNGGKDVVLGPGDYATLSHFPWLSPRGGQNVDLGINSCKSELDQHSEKGPCLHGVDGVKQNVENNRLKSDELVATLERLRKEAKSIAETLESYNHSSRIEKATTALPGIYSGDSTGLLSKCQSAPPSLTG